jgi:glycosyltransferase involved in cell wall biosynthesis
MLSVAIITFNEEKNIARCLDSVKHLANEIIVLDSLSTDKTKAICEAYGVRFIEQTFLGYIEQKNKALEFCTQPFILCLDADECLDETLQKSIEKIIKTDSAFDAFMMKRCTNFCGHWIRHGAWYPDKKIRLIKNGKGFWGGTNPHDKIILSNNATIKELEGDILHYSFYSPDEFITQSNKFTTIQAQAMLLQNKKSNWFKIIINPIVAFVNGYFFKLGFLDGWDGYFIAKTIAYFTRVKYLKLMRLQQQKIK